MIGRGTLLRYAAAGVFALATIIQTRPAEACTCVHIDGCGAIRPTDVVFEATVDSIELEPPPVPGRISHRYIVRLTDIKALRGKPESIIFMDLSGASCDYKFTAGTRYVIHAAVVAEGYLAVNTCTMTRPVGFAKGVLACLKRD